MVYLMHWVLMICILFDEAPREPKRIITIMSHLFGGCVMGTDRKVSVCDGHGKVYDREGLYIADASMIPSTLGVNPQHTIMALSHFVAEGLLGVH